MMLSRNSVELPLAVINLLLPAVEKGHFADLVLSGKTTRIWRSRMTLADGEREPLYVEFLVNGRWVDIKDHPDHERHLLNDRIDQRRDVPLDYDLLAYLAKLNDPTGALSGFMQAAVHIRYRLRKET